MYFLKKTVLGCNIIVALFFLTACQDSDDASLKKNQPIESAQQKSSPEPIKDTLTQEGDSQALKKDKNITPTADIYLNTNPESPPQESAFNCDDQVYLTIKFADHKPKLHQINILWKDPNGTAREKNSFPFFVTEKESLAWASLKLHRSLGAGMLQLINPAAGMEEFIGTWSAEVKVGNIINKKLNFEVLC